MAPCTSRERERERAKRIVRLDSVSSYRIYVYWNINWTVRQLTRVFLQIMECGNRDDSLSSWGRKKESIVGDISVAVFAELQVLWHCLHLKVTLWMIRYVIITSVLIIIIIKLTSIASKSIETRSNDCSISVLIYTLLWWILLCNCLCKFNQWSNLQLRRRLVNDGNNNNNNNNK